MIWNVLVAGSTLLGQVVRPPQELQHRADEILLGSGLIGMLERRELLVRASEIVSKVSELRRRSFPLSSRPYTVGRESTR